MDAQMLKEKNKKSSPIKRGGKYHYVEITRPQACLHKGL